MKLLDIYNKDVHKIIQILGIKFKFKSKKLIQRQKIDLLEQELRRLKYKLYKYCAPEMRTEALKDWYYESTGKTLNLENPQTFNEKIQWLKLYDSTPLKTRLADKYLVREWVKEKIGEEYLIPLLGVWDKFDDINFDELPEKFVLKCNHGSGYNIVVKDKSKLDIEDTRQKINSWMNEDFAFKVGFETHYTDIPRKIIAEKYIEEIAEGTNVDYHVFCFNGKPKLFYLTNRKGLEERNWSFYDINLQMLPIYHLKFKNPAPLEINSNLEKMLKFVKILCKDFIFVRVDMYCSENMIYFGEMTFTPGSGLCTYTPETWELQFGQMLKLPDMPKTLDMTAIAGGG